MKKTMYRIIVFLIAVTLLLSLSGCGALLNGDKQLTSDKLVASDSSNSSSSSSSGSLNSSQATIQLKMYKLTNKTGSTNFWITYTPFSSNYNYVYLFPLNSTGNNSYSLVGGTNSSSYSYKKSINNVTTGYTSFSSIGSYDAYFLGRESSSGYNLEAFSNVVDSDDIICFDANSNYTGKSSLSHCFTDSCYATSSYSSGSSQTKPTTSSSNRSSTYNYLWVQLDHKVWVCLGYVSQ